MRTFFKLVFILTLVTLACGGTEPLQTPSATPPAPAETQPTASAIQIQGETASPTSTHSPAGTIFVDTLEQEAYPYPENGNCSLAEAMIAADSGKTVDSCAAGVPGKSVIVLKAGDYHFSQPDTSPPLFEWMPSILDVESALPPVVFPLTIQGNGAVLTRDDGSEPFRFFEVAVNSKLTLENMTLQNGDVSDDDGGAIYAMNALLELNNVRLLNNRANNGGALYFTLGGLTIQNSEFIGNFAARSGGALHVSSSRAAIQSTRFESNASDSSGGGMFADFVTLVLNNSLFLKNRVTGNGVGTRGGGVYLTHVNANITESQFYQNEAPSYGGAIAISNPELAGIDPEEGDPIEPLNESPIVTDMLTGIPGIQATLEAHPSGIYSEFHEDSQIHNNCFANNATHRSNQPNWTSGILGRASQADGNYWGDPSGPGGMGPGTGDQVGKRIVFTPFLTAMPAHCDPELADQK